MDDFDKHRLRLVRQRSGLTQTEMATRLGLKLKAYQALEGGRPIMPAQQKLARLIEMQEQNEADKARLQKLLDIFGEGALRTYREGDDITSEMIEAVRGAIGSIDRCNEVLESAVDRMPAGDA